MSYNKNRNKNVPNVGFRQPDRPAIEFLGVNEGNDFDFNSLEVCFYYGENGLALESNDDGDIYFDDFLQTNCDDKSRVLNQVIVDNLKNMNVYTMRPIQVAVYEAVFFSPPPIAPRQPDFIGVSSTGSGKTIAFVVPAIQKCLMSIDGNNAGRRRNPKFLIFAHTTTLVHNIYQTVKKLAHGTPLIVKLITGGKALLTDGYFDIGICTAGRFWAHLKPGKGTEVKISLNELEYVIIDESDKLAECEIFRKIVSVIKQEKPNVPKMMFSATYKPNILQYIDENNYYRFACGAVNEVAASVKQGFWQCNSKANSRISGAVSGTLVKRPYPAGELRHPFDLLHTFVMDRIFKEGSKKKVIVFMKKTVMADMIAQRLKIFGCDAIAVHGKMPEDKQEKYLEQFISGQVRILCATNKLTRGTDIDIDFVINYDLPEDYVEYVHRCGRTGRNKKKGYALTFIDFNNASDYNPVVLDQIALKLDENEVSEFMKPYVRHAKKIHEAEMINKENSDYEDA